MTCDLIQDLPFEHPSCVFWSDWRLSDLTTMQHGRNSLKMFWFSDQFRGTYHHGFPKTGHHRTKFLIQSVQDLRNSFKQRGSQLIVRYKITLISDEQSFESICCFNFIFVCWTWPVCERKINNSSSRLVSWMLIHHTVPHECIGSKLLLLLN
jgi:hypothetical protein